jgi:predicted SAM-dependent methyltransferase
MSKEIKLHLGCGKRYLPGYIHIDINNLPHIEYCTEIHKLSMFEDNSVSEIYNCGVIGYYDREEVNVLLKEWRRVLKKDGILRISVVDFEKQVHLYHKGDKSIEDTGVLGPLFGKWTFIDKLFNKGVVYKKTAYDYKSLKRVLESHGFGEYRRYEWQSFLPENYDDYSAAYVPHGDKSGVHIMLNVECKKC